ncbi:MAG: hypothetical protein A2096_00115 [Spirochaetes bacterium GWF1_41_5]|nr:MAG: hypothetical protein A2096_00115 [Spirochaetes bacterium GWF1_41_5]
MNIYNIIFIITIISLLFPVNQPAVVPALKIISHVTNAAKQPTTLLTIKALSYNILYGAGVDREFDNALQRSGQYKQYGGRNRLPELLAYIKKVDPDIIGIQEASGWARGNPPVIQKAAQELGMNFYLAESAGGHHVCLLTKFKIKETENLSSVVGPQGVLRASLNTPDGDVLNVFVIHLNPHSTPVRLCQTDALIKKMQPYHGQRTIMMGDMNFSKDTGEYKKLIQAGWKTVTVWGIDMIWASPKITWAVTSWFNSKLPQPKNLSDHPPAGAEINFFSRALSESGTASVSLLPEKISPAPSFLSNIFSDVQIADHDGLDNFCACIRWSSRWTSERFTNKMLEITSTGPWKSSVRLNKQFTEGQGTLILYKMSVNSEAVFYFDNNQYYTNEQYRRFGINIKPGSFRPQISRGKTALYEKKISGSLIPAADKWQYIMTASGPDGEMLIYVWEPADSSRFLVLRESMEKDWCGQKWSYHIVVHSGQVFIDEYSVINFSSIR